LVTKTTPLDRDEVERVLREREDLQSTGLGESVAIPHGALAGIENQIAAIILSPPPIDFAAIDGRPVHIIVAVLSPKRAAGEHLKTLALVPFFAHLKPEELEELGSQIQASARGPRIICCGGCVLKSSHFLGGDLAESSPPVSW
jgi:mannitol/fructose-specific phosphotransferase system IIA component (Ntr-type)